MKKDKIIIVRVDQQLKDIVEIKCKKIGIGISDYTRHLYLYGEIKIVPDQTKRDLRGIAINVNQIAKKFNGGSIAHNNVIFELQTIIEELKKLNLR